MDHTYEAPQGQPIIIHPPSAVMEVAPPTVTVMEAAPPGPKVHILIPFSSSRWRDANDIFLIVICFSVGHPDETAPTPPQAPVREFQNAGVFLFGLLAKIQAPTTEGVSVVASDLTALIRLAAVRLRFFMLNSLDFTLTVSILSSLALAFDSVTQTGGRVAGLSRTETFL
jgi:hypothetical protein